MKTVLMTADTVGGVFTYAMTLCHELAARGVSVHLATMGGAPRPEQRRAAFEVPGLVLHESTYALEWMRDPWDDVARAGEWLVALEAEVGPEVVHLNGYCHAGAGFRAPTLVVGHSCVLSWWRAVHRADAPAEYDTYRQAVRRGLAAADAVVAPSAAMLGALHTHYGPLSRARVVPNGARAPRAAPADKEPFVLSAGRLWDPAKNVAAVARVAPRLPWPVKVAGPLSSPDDERADLDDVDLLGWLDREALGEVMERAAVFAHPARYEPFGIAALEAALRGCALVLGDIPSQREIWDGAALFVAPDDDDALAEALASLARDPARRASLAARAIERARALTPERMTEGTLAVYEQIQGVTMRSPVVEVARPCA